MRYARGHKDEARARILDAAGRGFRKHGSSIGVDGLAKEAGVTSGAFYGHFHSKAEAFRAVVATGLGRLRAGIETFQAEHHRAWVDAFAAFYLGAPHRHDIAGGCALPSLSAEVGRADEVVRATYQTELQGVADAIASGLPSDTPEHLRDTAWVMLALLAGGVVMARGVRDGAVAEEIADAVSDAVSRLAQHDQQGPEAGTQEVRQ